MKMKELTEKEMQQVNGGIGPLVAIAGSYALGWIGGYVTAKYGQSQIDTKSSGCAPTC